MLDPDHTHVNGMRIQAIIDRVVAETIVRLPSRSSLAPFGGFERSTLGPALPVISSENRVALPHRRHKAQSVVRLISSADKRVPQLGHQQVLSASLRNNIIGPTFLRIRKGTSV